MHALPSEAVNCDKHRKAVGSIIVCRFGTNKSDSESIKGQEQVNGNVADGSFHAGRLIDFSDAYCHQVFSTPSPSETVNGMCGEKSGQKS